MLTQGCHMKIKSVTIEQFAAIYECIHTGTEDDVDIPCIALDEFIYNIYIPALKQGFGGFYGSNEWFINTPGNKEQDVFAF